jgi:hypothetical protein
MMDWVEARAIIGQHSDGDYKLFPLLHADLYDHSAPELSKILRSGGPLAEAKAYELADKEAIEAQSLYKNWMFRTNAAVLVTSVLGAAALGAAIYFPIDPHAEQNKLGRLLALIATLAAAFGGFSLFKLRESGLLESWMTARANAETHRLGYFSSIVNLASLSSEAKSLCLTLEYVLRYQLDVEKAFYSVRSAQHKKSANKTVTIGATGAALAVLAGAAATTGPWAALGALSVTGAAIGAFATGREQMLQDRRNAERYRRTWNSLNGLCGRIDDVRAAAASNNGSAVAEFVAAVNDQISLEHRQWLDSSEANKAALARLEIALSSKDNIATRTDDTAGRVK